MTRYLNLILNGLFDLLLAPFRTMGPWPGMIVVSLVTSVLILLIFRATSNQASVKRKKDRLLARVLELTLFKDDIVITLGAFGRVLSANMAYMRELIRPICVSVLPVLLILAQVSTWFGARPLRPGETVLLTVHFLEEFPVMDQSVWVEGSDTIAVETDAVRIPSRNEISWRFRAKDVTVASCSRRRQTVDSDSWIDVNINGHKARKQVTVGMTVAGISRERGQSGFWNELKNPVEPPLPQDSPLASIEIAYPDYEFALGKLPLNWLGAFIVLTLLFGWVLKRPLGVEI